MKLKLELFCCLFKLNDALLVWCMIAHHFYILPNFCTNFTVFVISKWLVFLWIRNIKILSLVVFHVLWYACKFANSWSTFTVNLQFTIFIEMNWFVMHNSLKVFFLCLLAHLCIFSLYIWFTKFSPNCLYNDDYNWLWLYFFVI